VEKASKIRQGFYFGEEPPGIIKPPKKQRGPKVGKRGPKGPQKGKTS